MRLLKNDFYNHVQKAYEQGASKEALIELLGRGRAKKGMFEGDLTAGELEIGQIAGLMSEVLPAKKIIENLIEEFEEAKKELLTDLF